MERPYNGIIPGGDITTKIPKIGAKLKVTKEPIDVLVRIANEIVKGDAFSINPEDTSEEPWIREAKISVGTMFLNYRVSTRGQGIICIGYKNKTKIDVILESQADTLLDILKTLGREDIVLTTIYLPDKPK